MDDNDNNWKGPEDDDNNDEWLLKTIMFGDVRLWHFVMMMFFLLMLIRKCLASKIWFYFTVLSFYMNLYKRLQMWKRCINNSQGCITYHNYCKKPTYRNIAAKFQKLSFDFKHLILSLLTKYDFLYYNPVYPSPQPAHSLHF